MEKLNSFKISVVIPTYNEEGNIKPIVEKIFSSDFKQAIVIIETLL